MDHPAVLVVVVIQIRNELVPEMSNCHQLCIVQKIKNSKFVQHTTYIFTMINILNWCVFHCFFAK